MAELSERKVQAISASRMDERHVGHFSDIEQRGREVGFSCAGR